jgi:hypothetical protein
MQQGDQFCFDFITFQHTSKSGLCLAVEFLQLPTCSRLLWHDLLDDQAAYQFICTSSIFEVPCSRFFALAIFKMAQEHELARRSHSPDPNCTILGHELPTSHQQPALQLGCALDHAGGLQTSRQGRLPQASIAQQRCVYYLLTCGQVLTEGKSDEKLPS